MTNAPRSQESLAHGAFVTVICASVDPVPDVFLGGLASDPELGPGGGILLDNRKLGQHFSVEHLDHALVDLAPTVANARDVEQDRTMLPEWALLHVVDKANG
ncbi:hypothetical protein HG531_008559 [Fusarium graminearum]|nr:hypothetical protein HG531_008559 [Fusarium graminearum]